MSLVCRVSRFDIWVASRSCVPCCLAPVRSALSARDVFSTAKKSFALHIIANNLMIVPKQSLFSLFGDMCREVLFNALDKWPLGYVCSTCLYLDIFSRSSPSITLTVCNPSLRSSVFLVFFLRLFNLRVSFSFSLDVSLLSVESLAISISFHGSLYFFDLSFPVSFSSSEKSWDCADYASPALRTYPRDQSPCGCALPCWVHP